MFVKPKSGIKVRDPETGGFLPEAGKVVPPSIYWARRVRDGDAIETTPTASAPAPAVKEEAR